MGKNPKGMLRGEVPQGGKSRQGKKQERDLCPCAQPPADHTDGTSKLHARVGGAFAEISEISVSGSGMFFSGHGPTPPLTLLLCLL